MLPRRYVWRLLSALVICSLLVAYPASTNSRVQAAGPSGRNATADQLQAVGAGEITAMPAVSRSDLVQGQDKNETEPGIYIIQLSDAPLATYRGGVLDLEPTSPSITGEAKLNVESEASQAYRSYLATRQSTVLDRITQQAGRSVEPIHVYDVAYNGMALWLSPDEAAQVAAMPGVARVIRSFDRYIQTDTTPEFLNAVGIWDGTNTGSLSGTRGEGMVIGILDTGINMGNPSFAAVAADGYTHTNPLGDGVYAGWCDPSHPSYDAGLACNAKLIGVYSYPSSGNDPIDDNSHGSHTASTAAGNLVYDVSYGGYTFDQISGMAPRANIIAYDVCAGSGCPIDSILAGIDDAIADGVDVINYSIGGGPQSPWGDPDSEAFLNARDAGIFVATSAGNDGPDAGTVGSPGNAPWVTTVANTSIARVLAHTLDVTGPGTVPGTLQGLAAVSGEGPSITSDIAAPIVYAGAVDASNVEACSAFPANAFSGSIALVQRGDCTFATKVTNAYNAGAVAVVVYSHVGGPPPAMGGLAGTLIPSVALDQTDGEAVRDWILAQANPTAQINASQSRIVNADWADVMAAGSSRGPNVIDDYIKPDIAAPGTNVFAAYAGAADAYGMMSGTSMASPHVAGAGALLAALYPDWTPAEIQSALMMTSHTDGLVKEDATTPADPFDVGAGRLDLTGAALAGLVLDETTANYLAADPASGGDPTALNTASLASGACLSECSWERTFRNPTNQPMTWAVTSEGDVPLVASPQTFSVGPDATQTVVFTATVSSLTAGAWYVGQVILTPDGAPDGVLHLPVTVKPTTGILPSLFEINTRRDAGSQRFTDLQAIEITDLATQVHGLVPATLIQEALIEDPTYDDPFDGPDGTFYQVVDVPAGALRLVAEIIASEAPDLDLFVGRGNTPSEASLVCTSATASWDERCNIANPEAGNWWILVQNWQGSSSQPDALTLAMAVVPADDADNMTIDGPTSVPAMAPFDLTILWDAPDMTAGDRWYGAVTLGSSAGSPNDIGTFPVDLIRHEDDVVKTVSQAYALQSDVLTYTITVLPNVTSEDLAYVITDTIPAGLSYVPGSATASSGAVSVIGNTLIWTGTMEAPIAGWDMTTSLDDLACAVPLANDGAFLDLSVYGIAPSSAIYGDTIWFSAFSAGAPFLYWGQEHTGIGFTDDGMAFFSSTPGNTPWENQDIPTAADPNNLLAMLWNDWEVVYDGATNRGVSLAALGGTGAGGGAVIQFTGMQPYQDPTQTIDFEVFVWRTPSDLPGEYEVYFAYNNINATLDTGTVGIENATGTDGVRYAYDDAALDTLEDGMAICFDWISGELEPVVITYQVEVTETAGRVLNAVTHETDNPGSQPATTYAELRVGHWYWYPIISRFH